MSKLIKLVFLVFAILLVTLSVRNTKADECIGGLSQVSILNTHFGMSVTFTGHSGYAGTILSSMDGDSTDVYCVDLYHNVGLPDHGYTDTCAYAESKVQYILNHYFPYKNGYVGQLLDNNQEAASIQAAIWVFTDGINPQSITDPIIRSRAIDIMNDADVNGFATLPIATFFLHPGVSPDGFFVQTLNENGDPISISNIVLSITGGRLAQYITSTDSNANGFSPEIIVDSAGSGSVIMARARMLYSQGWIVGGITPGKQSLTIAYPVYGEMGIYMEWGALPVELSSFTSTVMENTVVLNWTTTTETNNFGFKIERSVAETNVWTITSTVAGNGTSTTSHQYTYTDRGLNSGTYKYRLKQIDYNGNFEYFNLTDEVVVGIPEKYSLSQNYPNPFNPVTTIHYSIPEEGEGVTNIKVFDISGKEVMTVVNEFKTAGQYSVQVNANNLSSGIYYYKLTAGNFTAIKKMTLIK